MKCLVRCFFILFFFSSVYSRTEEGENQKLDPRLLGQWVAVRVDSTHASTQKTMGSSFSFFPDGSFLMRKKNNPIPEMSGQYSCEDGVLKIFSRDFSIESRIEVNGNTFKYQAFRITIKKQVRESPSSSPVWIFQKNLLPGKWEIVETRGGKDPAVTRKNLGNEYVFFPDGKVTIWSKGALEALQGTYTLTEKGVMITYESGLGEIEAVLSFQEDTLTYGVVKYTASTGKVVLDTPEKPDPVYVMKKQP